jgi:hypothetical protein
MQTGDHHQVEQPRRRRDLPALIKYILLILLILLLLAQIVSGDFGRLAEGNVWTWIILLFKLLLIALLIWLIQVQKQLTCELVAPTGCTDEEVNQALSALTVEVVGSAGGSGFSHYTLEWRRVEGQACQDNAGWSSDGVHNPGGGSGSSPVTNGTLGWLDTTVWSAGSYEVRLCVYGIFSSQPTCCCIQFDLFKQFVWIQRVGINPGAPVQTPPGPFDSSAPVVNTNPGGGVVPVGGCVTVEGSAWVGECNNRKIKCFDLRYAVGFLPGPIDAGFNPAAYTGPNTGSLLTAPLCYEPPDEADKRAQWNWVISRALTTRLVKTQITIFGSTYDVWKLQDYCFNSADLLPACPDAQHHCRSGQFTLLLQVEDTLGNLYYDTQRVWFDNKPIHVEFGGIAGLAACTDLHLEAGGPFVPAGAPCGSPWPADLMGIAYDEYIDEADLAYPSDNFDFYLLRITRQGGPTYSVPITPALSPPVFGPDPLRGTSRVGEPGTRCEVSIPGCTLVNPVPPKAYDVLTQLDLRVFDADCAASLSASFAPPAGFALKRGTCCGYTFQLFAQDKTWSNGWAGGFHRMWSLPWAICICNDLPPDKRKS